MLPIQTDTFIISLRKETSYVVYIIFKFYTQILGINLTRLFMLYLLSQYRTPLDAFNDYWHLISATTHIMSPIKHAKVEIVGEESLILAICLTELEEEENNRRESNVKYRDVLHEKQEKL